MKAISLAERNAQNAARVPKLPQWAQDHIADLNGKIGRLEEELKDALMAASRFAADLPAGSPFKVEVGDHIYPVGGDATVTVKVNGGELTLNVDTETGRLHIDTPTGNIVVRPRYANLVTVEVEALR